MLLRVRRFFSSGRKLSHRSLINDGRCRWRPTMEPLEDRQLLAGDLLTDGDTPVEIASAELSSQPSQVTDSPWLGAPELPAPTGNVVNVANEAELQQAMNNLANNTTILIAPGTYNLSRTLWVQRDNVTIRGASNNHDDVVLVGRGMENANYGNVPHGIWTNAANLKVQNLTIRDVYFHPIQFDPAADSPHVYNVKLLDAGEQFIKSSSSSHGVGVDNGTVEYTIMEYTNSPPTQDHGGGTGYTNGVDVLGGENWVISNNLFKNFHTPNNVQHLWNPAILMWRGSRGTIAERNTFIDVDRAIAFGLTDQSPYDHAGGVIRNNFIYQRPNLFTAPRRSSSDGQIIVWDSPNTKVLHNTILTNGNSLKSIEFRFNTNGAEARNNLIDAPIGSRNGASFSQSGNVSNATASMFVDPSSGNPHLNSTATLAIDAVDKVLQAATDIDGQTRPIGPRADAGADEYEPGGPSNQRPNAVDDQQSITEDANPNPVTGNVLTNDTDADGDVLSVVRVAGSLANVGQTINGNYGQLLLRANGTFDYTLDNANTAVNALNNGETLTDSFTYVASDGTDTDLATLTLTIHGSSDPGPPGAMDIIGRSNNSWRVARSTGNNFDTTTFGPSPNQWQDARVADVNGDGIDDVVGRYGGMLWVARSTGASLVTEQWGAWSDRVQWIDYAVADVNGDGAHDVVGRTPGGDWWVAKSTTTSFVNENWGSWSAKAQWEDVNVADVDGDGNSDLIGRTRGHWWVAKSNGTSFVNQHWGSWSTRVRWTHVHVVDVDGNGRDDIIGMAGNNWWVAKSTGTSLVNERWGMWTRANQWTEIRVGDFNGDGRDDVAGRLNGHWWIAASTGTSFRNEKWGYWSNSVDWLNVFVADYDGDGRDDIAGRVGGSWWVARSTGSEFTNELWDRWSANDGWTNVMPGNFAD